MYFGTLDGGWYANSGESMQETRAIQKRAPVPTGVPVDSAKEPQVSGGRIVSGASVGRSWLARLGELVAAPTGIMILVPLLVMGVGLTMALQGQRNLQIAIDTMSQDRFSDLSKQAMHQTRRVLLQAPLLLKRWRLFIDRHKGLPSKEMFAQHLVDLMEMRPSISWLSYGREDGTFWGVFRTEQGHFILTTRQMQKNGFMKLKDYRIFPWGLKLVRYRPKFIYNHRIRPWYVNAMKQKERVWSEPYTFFSTGIPGITCSQRHLDKANNVYGVFTVDFSLNTMSSFIEGLNRGVGGKTFVFSRKGILLAYPGLRRNMMELKYQGNARLLTMKEHKDGLLRSFLSVGEKDLPTRANPQRYFSFSSGEKVYHGSILHCPIDKGLNWLIGSIVARSAFVKPVKQHRRAALWVALLSLGVALLLSAFFAWYVSRSRRALVRARAETRAAKQEVLALGSYTLVKWLDGGGMGEVWEGKHQMLARPAAIKLIRSDVLKSEDFDPEVILERFALEARVTAQLSSPHTVRLFDYGVSDDGSFYYVMELLQGMDLRQLVLSHGAQPIGRVVHVLQQVCLSLAEAHEKGLVHRDLKPANVFLSVQGTELDFVKVLDFGVVHVDSAKSKVEEAMVGTPAFMSPEQIRGDSKLDGRTDLYAVGCLAYWMLTGQFVFTGNSVKVILDQHLHVPPQPPSLLCPFRVPEELDELIMGCLAKLPDHRPARADVVLKMLESIDVPDGQKWGDLEIRRWWSIHLPEASPLNLAHDPSQNALITTPVPAAHPTIRTSAGPAFPTATAKLVGQPPPAVMMTTHRPGTRIRPMMPPSKEPQEK